MNATNILDKYINNKTKFAIHKINYQGGDGYDKNYITKVFLDIWCKGYDIVWIENRIQGPPNLSGYMMYDDYYIMSNGSKIIFNSDLVCDYVCYIVSDELEQTNFNYFIMELSLFESKYEKFKTKLLALIAKGYDVKSIKYFFEEFTKEPEIDIL